MADQKKIEPSTIEAVLLKVLDTITPPERIDIAQAVERYRIMTHPVLGTDLWNHDDTPYLKEPMQLMTSLQHTSLVFCGPAQCGKTELFLNLYFYVALFDPCDMKMVQTTQDAAARFSRGKVARLHDANPAVKARLRNDRNSDNIHTKIFETGAIVSFTWPTVTTLAGDTAKYMFNTDYDRPPEDIGGDGNAFMLSQNRVKSYGRYGMNIAESSPSRDIIDPRWSPATPHEAPPTTGILALYNQGDRRKWYWPCANCESIFEPHWDNLRTVECDTIAETAKTVWMCCPHCAVRYLQSGEGYADDEPVMPSRREMNIRGFWLKDGDTVDLEGRIISGSDATNKMASYWLNGVAATFEDWEQLIITHRDALKLYETTGNEGDLKAFFNTSLGMAYTRQAVLGSRLPDDMKKNAVKMGTEDTPVVPLDVRFLIAAVDVQKNRFVVQIHGIGENNNVYVIDRFDIEESRRINEKSKTPGAFFRIDPFVEPEDWKLLLSDVITKQYPLADRTGQLPCPSGRTMKIFQTIVDSGGGQQTTANVYEFDNWLRRGPTQDEKDTDAWDMWVPGLDNHFMLFKGRKGSDQTPIVEIKFPTSQEQKKFARATGNTPILFGKSNELKDFMDYNLRKLKKPSGAVWYAHWLDDSFYKELCAESRNPKGEWVNLQNVRNEAWDLLCMMLAMLYCKERIGIENLDWDNPPKFAWEWDKNPYIVSNDGKNNLETDKQLMYNRLREQGARLG